MTSMFKNSRTLRSQLLFATALANVTPAAWAQDTAVPNADEQQEAAAAQPAGSEEIVITAQKRTERLQDATVAATSISAEAIDRLGVRSLEDLVRTVPSLNISSFGGTESYVSLRGLATNYGLSPSVSTYVEDVSYDFRSDAYSGASIIDPFDLERIEVLRGPQGTVLGASSLGGAIRLVTARPDPSRVIVRAETTMATTRGGDQSYSVRGAVNLPLASNLALRLVTTYRDDGGWIDRSGGTDFVDIAPSAITERNENDNQSVLVRGALQWQPDERLTVTPYFIYQDNETAGKATYEPEAGRFVRQHLFLDRGRFKFGTAALRVEGDLGGATLVSSTSFTRKKTRAINDFTGFGQFIGIAFGLGPTYLPMTFDVPVGFRQFTQEVRLVSDDRGPLRWILGAYYNRQTQTNKNFLTSDAYAPLLGTRSLVEYSAPARDEQYAGYGEATFATGSGFEITGGLRVYKLKQRLEIMRGGLFGGAPAGPDNSSESGVNPRLTLAYKPNGNVNVYGTFSRGFRPGGPNIGIVEVPPCTFIEAFKNSYGSDTVDNLEAGAKLQFADRRIRLNAAAYQLNWKNIQGFVSSSCGGFVANFGTARVKGFEFESQVNVSENIRLGGTLSFNDAKLRKVDPVLLAAGVGVPGQRLIDVPRWQYGVNASFLIPVAGKEFFFDPSWQRVGSAPAAYSGTPIERPAYNNVDIRTGVRFGNYEIAAFARNLTDDLQVLNASRAFFFDNIEFSVGRPRTFGITLSMKTQ